MRKLVLLTSVIAGSACVAQTPLPKNYKTVIDNADVLVQQVHYGPHETVPMHDHPAVTTVYVYLNDDKGFTIIHEGAEAPVHRPPSHAGAFRVSPGNLERHSIVNDSDAPSDFVRVELRKIPVHTLTQEFRGKAPTGPVMPGVKTEYSIPQLRVVRITCDEHVACDIPADSHPSVLVAIPDAALLAAGAKLERWIGANEHTVIDKGSQAQQYVRIVLLNP